MWYEAASHDAPLTQGDIVFDCPIIEWVAEAPKLEGMQEDEVLERSIIASRRDVVVMSQACDLEQGKVQNVIVCPHLGLNDYRQAWTNAEKARNQGTGINKWRSHCDHIKRGYIWNLAMLDHGDVGGMHIEHRIVDFRDIHTIPIVFLQALLLQRAQQRLRIIAPYREHLSQAFARFFMRVGLPTDIEVIW